MAPTPKYPGRYFDTTVVNVNDRHVLAAARFHNVDFVVTNDRRLHSEINRWIGEQLRSHLAAAVTADELVGRLVAEDETKVRATVQAMADRTRNPPRTFAHVLGGLVKSLPSLATDDSV